MIPTFLVIDNFYTDLNSVKNIIPEMSSGIGCNGSYSSRSNQLQNINLEFFNFFSHSLCSMYGIDYSKVVVTTFFNKQIKNPISIYNKGMIHIDGRNSNGSVSNYSSYPILVGGTIVLKKAENSFIQLYKNVSDKTEEQKFYDGIHSCYNEKNSMSSVEYEKYLTEYDSKYKLINSSSCEENRLISWKAGIPHKTFLNDDELLTQSFYISVV